MRENKKLESTREDAFVHKTKTKKKKKKQEAERKRKEQDKKD